jgi:hypothetical protein
MTGPVRVIGPNRRSLTGLVTSEGASQAFESSLERDFLVLLDFNRRVQEFHTQPVTIHYRYAGRDRRYTPDAFVIFYGDDAPTFFEVKYREDLRRDWYKLRPGFKAAIKFAKHEGARFKIVTEREIRTPLLSNIKFLRHCRKQSSHESVEEQVVRTLAAIGESTPETLMRAAFRDDQHRLHALSALWRLVAMGRIEADLEWPISMQTPIWVEVGEGFRAVAPPYPP